VIDEEAWKLCRGNKSMTQCFFDSPTARYLGRWLRQGQNRCGMRNVGVSSCFEGASRLQLSVGCAMSSWFQNMSWYLNPTTSFRSPSTQQKKPPSPAYHKQKPHLHAACVARVGSALPEWVRLVRPRCADPEHTHPDRVAECLVVLNASLSTPTVQSSPVH
jgi:hypothetical protein